MDKIKITIVPTAYKFKAERFIKRKKGTTSSYDIISELVDLSIKNNLDIEFVRRNTDGTKTVYDLETMKAAIDNHLEVREVLDHKHKKEGL